MKKNEFLDAISGHVIYVSFYANSPRENGRAKIDGLPECLSGIHQNQILAWLKAWVPFKERKNSSLSFWEKRYDRMEDLEAETGFPVQGMGDAYEWVEWCHQHPDLIFNAGRSHS